MALEHILAAIGSDGETEQARIDAEAEARITASRHRVKAEIEAEERQKKAEMDTELRRSVGSCRAEGAVAEAAVLRRARGEVVIEAFAALRRRLAGLRGDAAGYRTMFARLCDEAITALPEATAIRVDARDADLVEEVLRLRDVRARVLPTLTTWGGVEAEDGQGRRVDNTLEARLDRAEWALRRMLAARLPRLRG